MPCWSDYNLKEIGEYIKSSVIFGHVRAASSGHHPHENVTISYQNCHPFKYGRYTFAHNGGIPNFKNIKRDICNLLSAENYGRIVGNTDSEHIFALFLNFIGNKDDQLSVNCLATAMRSALETVVALATKYDPDVACSLNMLITDGVHVVAVRYRNDEDQPPSLYYTLGRDYVGVDGNFSELGGSKNQIIVTSAPLNWRGSDTGSNVFVDQLSKYWKLIPKNTMLVCEGKKYLYYSIY
jgi:glutamine amidotransferase